MSNKEIAKYFYEHIISNNLIDELPQYISESCVVRIGETSIHVGIEGMKQHFKDVRKTYPDLKMTILRQFADGDTVISEFVMEGTHAGEWLGMKPTGKKLRMSGVDIDEFAYGTALRSRLTLNSALSKISCT